MTRDEIDEDPCKEVNEYIAKQDEELTALRSWKAKARPFLEHKYNVIKQGLGAECREDAVHPSLRPEWERMFKTLTELLGGSDEQND